MYKSITCQIFQPHSGYTQHRFCVVFELWRCGRSAVVCVACCVFTREKWKKNMEGTRTSTSEFLPSSFYVPSSSTSSSFHLPSFKYTLTNFNVCWHEKNWIPRDENMFIFYLSRLRNTWKYFIANQVSLKNVGDLLKLPLPPTISWAENWRGLSSSLRVSWRWYHLRSTWINEFVIRLK